MTNSYDVDHGLSQDAPGPLGLEAPDDTPTRTGNTARDQEMYAAGRAVGEENAQDNAAIRGAWLPIESAPKDGTPVLLFARLVGVNIATNSPYAPTIHVGAYRTDLRIWTGSAYRNQLEIELEPTHWMPRPAFPDCAAPASPVSTVEDAGAKKEAVMGAIADALGNAYDCMRVWSAWSVGTMSEDDFRLVADDAGRLGELADAAIAAMSPAPAAGDAQTDAARDVLAERQRQISVEGWEPERDDTYRHGELASAAASYAQCAGLQGESATTENAFKEPFAENWPWSEAWWKPSADPRRNLVKAGALILAEIERLDRAAIAAQRQGDA
ncbi:hypothetical protein [Achromobacter xylosoxidans]|uniref:DUF551 domain-containing protein n=1 Tax=Alcaligenes xylosoxydans xylosoxydans TaxID=85698 RepID=A0A0X8NXT3_ALCXX|nr:hypothetical protein [Achromobacter xylosoxidans]AMG36283.1 hypothetical protein AL504_09725 [Achromobacter xylosoxidans]